MSLLIYSGLLYLFGISLILYFKPVLMFSTDGNWKEFGLGRNKLKYTWMPFWLFTIMWAILSYLIVLMLTSMTGMENHTDLVVTNNGLIPQNVSTKAMSPVLGKTKPSTIEEMKKGYYILDVNETMKKGIPKYIFLGPEAPNLVYHNMTVNGDMQNAVEGSDSV